MPGEFQPRQLHPDEQIRADFIPPLTSTPNPEALEDRDLTESIAALTEIRSDVDQLLSNYYAQAQARGIEPGQGDHLTSRLERRFTEVLNRVPEAGELSDVDLDAVMETLASISYDIERKMQPLHEAAVARGVLPNELNIEESNDTEGGDR